MAINIRYLDSTTSSENLKPDIRLHSPFYALCQAAFYIFIFRNKALVEMEGGTEHLAHAVLHLGGWEPQK
jgi:hypothetical protein